jgi:predicted DNA-binding transcriptional regulator YafY
VACYDEANTHTKQEILICARVYQALGQWLDLPQPLASGMLDDLATQLDSATQSAVEQAYQQTIERLTQVIDGYAPRLDFSMNGLPQEQTLPIIQQALREEHDLDMTYWSAGRGLQTKRCIQPYRIEFKGKIAYLYAYCYQARDERCFRVDRIEQIKIEPRGFAR